MRANEPRHDEVRKGDFRPPAIVFLFIVLMTVASIPIATHPLPPLSDYINHLARTYVIDAVHSDPYLARFYEIDWQIIPNLMIDLIVPVLNRFMDVYLAGQIFTVLAFVLIASGALAFNRALTSRWSALPLIALPLLYNGVLLVGVMNYVFGIGLALWGLAAWVALRERPWPWRLTVSMLFALALYVCHLFAAGVYGLGLLAIELHRLWDKRAEPMPRRLGDFVATGLPFLPLLVLLMTSATLHTPGSPVFWELGGKVDGLMDVIKVYYSSVAIVLLAVVVIAAAFARWRNALGFHPVGWAILGVGAAAYLALPRAIFGAHLADQRLPIALAFMLVPCFTIALRRRIAKMGLVVLLALVLGVRVVSVQLVWNHLDRSTHEFVESVKMIKRGARVLVVYDERSSYKEISDFNLVHAASLATIERSALVTTAFTVMGKQILHARKDYRAFVETEDRLPPALPYFVQVADKVPAGVNYFWDLWPQHYDYVYILFTTAKTPNPAKRHLKLVYDGGAFDLYRVVSPDGGQETSALH